MLKIGKMADYGLLLTNQLAKTDKPLSTTEELAKATQLPLATVRKLLKKLVDAGIVASTRGARGGYVLAKAATDLTVADVINAIEGPIAITQCSGHDAHCSMAADCDLKENWSTINRVIATVLGQLSLADMANRVSERTIRFLGNSDGTRG